MNKWLEILFGLIIVCGTLVLAFYSQNWGIFNFWNSAIEILKGSIFWIVLIIGFILIVLGISDLKEA